VEVDAMSTRRGFLQSLGLLAAGAVVPLPKVADNPELDLWRPSPAEHRTLPPPKPVIQWGPWRYCACAVTDDMFALRVGSDQHGLLYTDQIGPVAKYLDFDCSPFPVASLPDQGELMTQLNDLMAKVYSKLNQKEPT
jgi:hypothetical protein